MHMKKNIKSRNFRILGLLGDIISVILVLVLDFD